MEARATPRLRSCSPVSADKCLPLGVAAPGHTSRQVLVLHWHLPRAGDDLMTHQPTIIAMIFRRLSHHVHVMSAFAGLVCCGPSVRAAEPAPEDPSIAEMKIVDADMARFTEMLKVY